MKNINYYYLRTLYFKLLQEFYLFWEKMYCEYPAEIGVLTINLLQQSKIPKRSLRGNIKDYSVHHEKIDITDMMLVNDPLIILKLDSRTFTCSILIQMILQILSAYIIASRNYLTIESQITPMGNNKKEDLNSLLLVQDSTILQILLEITISNEKSSSINQGEKEEIQTMICGFLHSQFIRNPTLIKLIHFQNYNHHLIPMLVKGVPSSHLCLEFMPELLSQSNRDKQLFAVKLGTQLIQKYPLTSR